MNDDQYLHLRFTISASSIYSKINLPGGPKTICFLTRNSLLFEVIRIKSIRSISCINAHTYTHCVQCTRVGWRHRGSSTVHSIYFRFVFGVDYWTHPSIIVDGSSIAMSLIFHLAVFTISTVFASFFYWFPVTWSDSSRAQMEHTHFLIVCGNRRMSIRQTFHVTASGDSVSANRTNQSIELWNRMRMQTQSRATDGMVVRASSTRILKSAANETRIDYVLIENEINPTWMRVVLHPVFQIWFSILQNLDWCCSRLRWPSNLVTVQLTINCEIAMDSTFNRYLFSSFSRM